MTYEASFVAPLSMRATQRPIIRTISYEDLGEVLAKGFADFMAKPTHMMFLCLIYPIVGVLLARAAMGSALMPLFVPLVAGFAIIGPFAAIGLYEISKRREEGLDTSWRQVFAIARSPSLGAICVGGLILLTVFIAWLAAANAIYDVTLGPAPPASLGVFVSSVLKTPAGWTLILFGNAVGFVFSVIALTIGIVTFPLLLDRDVGLATAIRTSARCVARNPLVLLVWGFIIAGTLLVAMLPLFVGLAIAMPVLGHATWHLYRKLVATQQVAGKPVARSTAGQFAGSIATKVRAVPNRPSRAWPTID